jgi:hypothetical protein
MEIPDRPVGLVSVKAEVLSLDKPQLRVMEDGLK